MDAVVSMLAWLAPASIFWSAYICSAVCCHWLVTMCVLEILLTYVSPSEDAALYHVHKLDIVDHAGQRR